MILSTAYRPLYGRTGLGVALTDMNTAQLASTATSVGGGIAAASLALVGLGPIGAIVGIGTALASLIISQFQGCGQTCVLTSNAANQIEQLLQQNLNAYMQVRTVSAQTQALANFDKTWNTLVQYCGSGQFGKAGVNCVDDRKQGACHYKTSPSGWNGCTYTGAGSNGSGSTCWNWFIGYRDPIANDPCVKPDATGVVGGVVDNSVVQSVAGGLGVNPIVLVAGLAIVIGLMV